MAEKLKPNSTGFCCYVTQFFHKLQNFQISLHKSPRGKLKWTLPMDTVNYVQQLIDSSLGKYISMGGPKSGHYGHAGRPGMRGGSAPRGGVGQRNFRSVVEQYGIKAKFNRSNVYKKDGGAYTLRDKEGKNWGYIVKNRETGHWELRADRFEYEGRERKEIAKFTDDLGIHPSPQSALNAARLGYGLTEKTTRATRFRTEKAIPSFIKTSEWDNKNYQKRFKEATGHKLDKNVSLAEAKTIAQSLQGMPQSQKQGTFTTHKSFIDFEAEYHGDASNARAFYGWDRNIHFGVRASKDIRQGRVSGIDIIRHEYGHLIDYSLRPGKYDPRSSLTKGTRIFDRTGSSGRFMTGHSRKNEREFFATAFSDLADAASMDDVGTFKNMFPEGHEMVNYVLGDRMPKDWK